MTSEEPTKNCQPSKTLGRQLPPLPRLPPTQRSRMAFVDAVIVRIDLPDLRPHQPLPPSLGNIQILPHQRPIRRTRPTTPNLEPIKQRYPENWVHLVVSLHQHHPMIGNLHQPFGQLRFVLRDQFNRSPTMANLREPFQHPSRCIRTTRTRPIQMGLINRDVRAIQIHTVKR